MPTAMVMAPTMRPAAVIGKMSPYPTVVIVVVDHQSAVEERVDTAVLADVLGEREGDRLCDPGQASHAEREGGGVAPQDRASVACRSAPTDRENW